MAMMSKHDSDPFLTRETQSRFFDSLSDAGEAFSVETHVADMIEVDPGAYEPSEVAFQAQLLVEHLGFTPDEAARYVAGDRTAIEAVAARRMRADEGGLASTENRSRTSRLSAD